MHRGGCPEADARRRMTISGGARQTELRLAASAPASARLSAHVKPWFLAATSVQMEDLRSYGHDDFYHSCSDGVNDKRHRAQRKSVTARRRDRISCIQACHLSEVALRVQFTCCVFLRSELQVQAPHESPRASSISAEVSNCPEVKETELSTVPVGLPSARPKQLSKQRRRLHRLRFPTIVQLHDPFFFVRRIFSPVHYLSKGSVW